MKEFKHVFAGNEIKVQLNKFAKQADSSVMIYYNNLAVLCTVVASKRESNLDFFPLIINYDEKLYAAGKIPGNYKRREGQPSEQATLSARMIDRPIRPLFPEGYKQELQVVCQVMSQDEDYEADNFAAIGASLALMIAPNIPFEGPIASVKVGYIDEKFVINPTNDQMIESKLDLKVSGTYDAINMVESSAYELSEELMVEALLFAHEQIKALVTWQKQVFDNLAIVNDEFINVIDPIFTTLKVAILEKYALEIKNALTTTLKEERSQMQSELKAKIQVELEISEDDEAFFKNAFSEVEKEIFRDLIIVEKKRVDGRRIDELRNLTSEIDLLPNVHGSAMFTRGETQVMSVATLGVKRDAQTYDGLEVETNKPFMLHYNFPPYSVGETGRMGAPSRREIGHGNLALNAIKPMLPSFEEFPYTIRVVAEVLESNGSSSQASICSASMALMQTGVPIKKQVAGIAMGLIADDNDYTILTDIQGLEDHLGDMDFKVAGTSDGITALQMDIKIKGVTKEILQQSLEQAKVARLKILENMNAIINSYNKELPAQVPKVRSFVIEVDKIKDVIGKGGDKINKIIEMTGVKIDIEEDGTVFVYSPDLDAVNKASEIILKIVKVYKKGEIYSAKVTRIEAYGAFVVFDESQDGLLHISNLSDKRVEKVEDVVKLEQEITVEIIDVDNKGRIKVKLNVSEE